MKTEKITGETPIQEELKIVGIPLSEITYEDLEYVKQFHPAYGDKWAVIYLLDVKLREGLLSYKAYQYLKSKGYQMGPTPVQEHKPESEENDTERYVYSMASAMTYLEWVNWLNEKGIKITGQVS